jgi:hypothetical protein
VSNATIDSNLALQTLERELEVRRMHHVQVLSLASLKKMLGVKNRRFWATLIWLGDHHINNICSGKSVSEHNTSDRGTQLFRIYPPRRGPLGCCRYLMISGLNVR